MVKADKWFASSCVGRVVRGAVDRRMDEHMTAHLHVGGEKYDIIMTLL